MQYQARGAHARALQNALAHERIARSGRQRVGDTFSGASARVQFMARALPACVRIVRAWCVVCTRVRLVCVW